MTEVYKRITVDLSRRSNVRLIFASQNDIGARNLMITLTDGGINYIPSNDCSATLNFKRSDEVCGAVAASILRTGDIVVEIPQIALAAPGITVCSVSLFDSEKNKLTSSDFSLDIGEEFYSGETIEDNPDYSLLQSLFAKMAEYATAESARAAAEETRKQNEDSRAMAEKVRDKKITANLGFGGSLKLSASAWDSDFSQTVTVPYIGDDDLVQFQPATRVDRAVMTNYRIFVEPDVSGGKARFVADAKPISDIALKYFITKGRAV